MKTVKEQNIIQPKTKQRLKKRSKILSKTVKLRKVFAPGPPDIETITGFRSMPPQGTRV